MKRKGTVKKWAYPSLFPYTFLQHDHREGLEVWRCNVTGEIQDWFPGDNPNQTGKYAPFTCHIPCTYKVKVI